MIQQREQRLIAALLDALMLDWQNNGNVSADSVRDGCITVLAEVLGKSFAEVQAMVEKRIDSLQ